MQKNIKVSEVKVWRHNILIVSARVETHSLAESEFSGRFRVLHQLCAHQSLNCGQKLIKVSAVKVGRHTC